MHRRSVRVCCLRVERSDVSPWPGTLSRAHGQLASWDCSRVDALSQSWAMSHPHACWMEEWEEMVPKVRKKRTEALGGEVGRAQIRQMVLVGGRLLHQSPWGSQRVFSKQMAQLDFCPSKFCHTDGFSSLRSLSLGRGAPSPPSFPLKWCLYPCKIIICLGSSLFFNGLLNPQTRLGLILLRFFSLWHRIYIYINKQEKVPFLRWKHELCICFKNLLRHNKIILYWLFLSFTLCVLK